MVFLCGVALMKIITAGGDLRQKTAIKILAEKGFEIKEYRPYSTEITHDDILLLPTPVTRDKIHLTAQSTAEPICIDEIKKVLDSLNKTLNEILMYGIISIIIAKIKTPINVP